MFSFPDANYGIDINIGSSLALQPRSSINASYVEEFNRLHRLKEELYSQLMSCTDMEMLNLIKEKLIILESHNRQIAEVKIGSIFIGIFCPDKISEDDLQTKYESGQLHESIMEAFEIRRLQEKYEVTSLVVDVKLRKLTFCPTGTYRYLYFRL